MTKEDTVKNYPTTRKWYSKNNLLTTKVRGCDLSIIISMDYEKHYGDHPEIGWPNFMYIVTLIYDLEGSNDDFICASARTFGEALVKADKLAYLLEEEDFV